MYYPVLCLLLLTIPHLSQAEQTDSPWLQPEVLKAAVSIELTDEQLPLFRAAITNLVNNQLTATNKLLRRNNIVDLDQKLKTATNRQFRKMDRDMGKFLSEAQHPQYLIYRKALRAQLTNSALTRSTSSSASISDTSKTLGQSGAQHH